MDHHPKENKHIVFSFRNKKLCCYSFIMRRFSVSPFVDEQGKDESKTCEQITIFKPSPEED